MKLIGIIQPPTPGHFFQQAGVGPVAPEAVTDALLQRSRGDIAMSARRQRGDDPAPPERPLLHATLRRFANAGSPRSGSEDWSVGMCCPCGYGQRLEMMVLNEVKPRWDVAVDTRGHVSLHPSVRLREGCRSQNLAGSFGVPDDLPSTSIEGSNGRLPALSSAAWAEGSSVTRALRRYCRRAATERAQQTLSVVGALNAGLADTSANNVATREATRVPTANWTSGVLGDRAILPKTGNSAKNGV